MPVELIWDGKYDVAGKRVQPVRLALPFQTIETINESNIQRQQMLDMFSSGKATDWRNRLIWGDKKYVLPSLLEEFRGKVDLIYIDPPFATGADFSFTAQVPNDETGTATSFVKQPSILEQKAYRDTWGRGLDGFAQWLYETLLLLKDLLKTEGSIYLHLDHNTIHMAKTIMDEVFGEQNFINEIIWKRQTAKADGTQGARHMGRIHETILLYSNSEKYTWNLQYTPYDQKYIDDFYRHKDSNGRRYRLSDTTAPGKATKGNPYYEFLGIKRFYRFSEEKMQKMYEEGRIVQTSPGTVPAQKRYLDEMPGVPLQSLWTDILPIQSQAHEGVGYATQNPKPCLSALSKPPPTPAISS